ncbi:hypothetical protein CBM2604_A80279 [Cupriavidus taiwanensis]|nr:hypothetical protein CBM2604_A80279 [Cupriavidus taiwanensis]SOZ42080.1 hypothetical protein CBM2610_A100278 [Cupriavidus taiwanensis]
MAFLSGGQEGGGKVRSAAPRDCGRARPVQGGVADPGRGMHARGARHGQGRGQTWLQTKKPPCLRNRVGGSWADCRHGRSATGLWQEAPGPGSRNSVASGI